MRESLTCVWQHSGFSGRCYLGAAQFPIPPILEPPCHWFGTLAHPYLSVRQQTWWAIQLPSKQEKTPT